MKSAVVTALLFATASYATEGGQANPEISVISSSYNQTQQSVEFTVLNASKRTVTAWQVSVVAKGADGARLQSKGWGTDSYLSAAGVVSKGSHINPGEAVTTSVPFPPIPDAAVAVDITMVIFSDGTAFGDPRDIEFIFEKRERDYSTWSEILTVLKDASRNETGLTALRKAEEQLAPTRASDNENAMRSSALGNIRFAISDAEKGLSNPVTRLELLISDAERRVAAAMAARRPPLR